jgi:protein phosphatase
MGTTLTAAVIAGDRLHVAHVGDSRAYLVRRGGIEQITRDHAVARDGAGGRVLAQALGPRPDVEVEVTSRDVGPADALVLCSDGLWETVEPGELGDIVEAEPSLARAAQRLVVLANDRGAPDNVTVVLARLALAAA